jgi:hypothetical protein
VSNKLRVVILGMMGRCPFGGQTWLYLNWIRALSRLGREVWYIEDDLVWPYDPEKNAVTADCSYAVRHIASCMQRVGLADRWAFRLPDPRLGESANSCWGMSVRELGDLYRSCDLLLNVGGATDFRYGHLALTAPYRFYIETDPVYAELRLANGDEEKQIAFDHHQIIATYGENYGAPDCGVPLNGLEGKYRKTRQPIDLELWPMVYDLEARFFTTIGNYRQSGSDVNSYPKGDGRAHPQNLQAVMQRAGYRAGCLYKGGPNRLPVSDSYRLTRLAMGPDTDLQAALGGR